MAPCGYLRSFSLALLVTALFSIGPIGIQAQTSDAVCLSQYSWMNNSKGQDACLISSYLQGACNGGQFNLDSLPSGFHYTGPYADEQNPCQCSTVTYTTVSACGYCQGRTYISWSAWNVNCTSVYKSSFPPGIPAGTAVPQWAYQDVTVSDLFNTTLAQLIGDAPESTPVPSQSNTGSVALYTITPTSSPSSDSSSNTGAIAGGIVGGIVAIALITGAIIFFVMRKKRSQIPPSSQFVGLPNSPAPPSAVLSDTTLSGPQMTQPKLYNPADPSTFPATPPPLSILSGSTREYQTGSTYSPVRPGHYTGIPEI